MADIPAIDNKRFFLLLRQLGRPGRIGRVSTYDTMFQRVCRSRSTGDTRVVHAFVRRLHRKLGDDAGNSEYMFTEARVGCRKRPGSLCSSKHQPFPLRHPVKPQHFQDSVPA